MKKKKKDGGSDPVILRKGRKKVVGVFIDGTGLDRAARRLNKRPDFEKLLKTITGGAPPLRSKYYILIPYEDDSRHRSFLDAVARSGIEVFVKRLPPKGVDRQVSTEVDMATDMMNFALGDLQIAEHEEAPSRSLIVICPTQDMAYTIGTIKETGAEVIAADFALYKNNQIIAQCSNWLDLSTAEGIWED